MAPSLNYHDALKAKTQAEADQYLDALTLHALRESRDLDPALARKIQRSNIGYCTGDLPHTPEGDRQRKLVFELYDCEHPIFGRAVDITPEEALQAGMIMGKAMKDSPSDIAAAIKKARESL